MEYGEDDESDSDVDNTFLEERIWDDLEYNEDSVLDNSFGECDSSSNEGGDIEEDVVQLVGVVYEDVVQVRFYFLTKCILWLQTIQNQVTMTIQDETCGSTVDSSCQSPLKCFSLFFSDVVFDFLTKNTNEYAM